MDIDSGNTDVMGEYYVERLQEVMEEREKELLSNEFFYYIRPALSTSSMRTLFKLAEILKVTVETKYMTIELYEEFISKYLYNCYKKAVQNPDELFTHAEQLSNNTYTFYSIITCFKLASKMDGKDDSLSILQNLPHLLQLATSEIASEYDPDLFICFERNILKLVGFKMPLHTPVHCIQVLLGVTGLINTKDMYLFSMYALDAAYLKHEALYEQFHLYFVCKNCQDKENMEIKVKLLKINTLFLSAAIVLCATFCRRVVLSDWTASTRQREEIIATRLAKLSKSSAQDITVMANTLLRIMSLDE